MRDGYDCRIGLDTVLFLISLVATDLALLRFTFTSESPLTGLALGLALVLTGALFGTGVGFTIAGWRGAEVGAIAGAALPSLIVIGAAVGLIGF